MTTSTRCRAKDPVRCPVHGHPAYSSSRAKAFDAVVKSHVNDKATVTDIASAPSALRGEDENAPRFVDNAAFQLKDLNTDYLEYNIISEADSAIELVGSDDTNYAAEQAYENLVYEYRTNEDKYSALDVAIVEAREVEIVDALKTYIDGVKDAQAHSA